MSAAKQRTLSFSRRPEGEEGILTIRDRGKFTRYWVKEVRADPPARVFRVEKFESDRNGDFDECYYVRLGPELSCECKGWLRWGYKSPCRHVAAIRELVARGKL